MKGCALCEFHRNYSKTEKPQWGCSEAPYPLKIMYKVRHRGPQTRLYNARSDFGFPTSVPRCKISEKTLINVGNHWTSLLVRAADDEKHYFLHDLSKSLISSSGWSRGPIIVSYHGAMHCSTHLSIPICFRKYKKVAVLYSRVEISFCILRKTDAYKYMFELSYPAAFPAPMNCS